MVRVINTVGIVELQKISRRREKKRMQSPCTKEASRACFHGCCPAPFLALPPNLQNTPPKSPHHDFIAATTSSLQPHAQFSNPDSLPPLSDSFSNFNKSYPRFTQTKQADQIRSQHYSHLSLSNHVCLDYVGHGLFSHSQQQRPHNLDAQFFDVLHKPATLNSQLLYGGAGESEFESRIRKRIMGFMNISEDDYSMVFTANKSSAFRLLADSYPFDSTQKLVTVYDHESEAVEGMAQSAAKRGARVRSAEFSWPSLRIQSRKLRKMIVMSKKKNKKRKMGLFVFPPQSRMTGARYSYLWMSLAQENCWDVLLDATALGAKDMETLGLSLFRPDFLICSFFKVFGQNPSGIGCLFVKKSIGNSVLNNNSTISVGIVSLVPSNVSSFSSAIRDPGPSRTSQTQIEPPDEEDYIEIETSGSDLECRGLDHADSLGLVLISSRGRFLVNWAVNALMSLRHPHSENGFPLVRIYGPRVRIDRGAVLAFNIFDWRRERIDPLLVQKLADRNNISISCGLLCHIWFSDKYGEEREKLLETRTDKEGENYNNSKKKKKRRGESSSSQSGIYVLSASLGFLTNFEDMYRLWAFVSRFLDADFVEKEKWRYMALNQTTIEV